MANDGPKWSDLKQRLNRLDHGELLGVIKDLYDYSAYNRTFLTARFSPKGGRGVATEEYRRRIVEQFYPKRGFLETLPKLAEARKAIREYRKATSDLYGTLDLMLTYVETGTRFTNEFGDMYESFYNSLQSVFGEACKLLQTSEGKQLYPQFEARIQELVRHAEPIGWGYADEIAYMSDSLRMKRDQ